MAHTIQAKNDSHLRQLILQEIQAYGEQCSLNHIDVSLVTSMVALFRDTRFNGDISEWDTSNVRRMDYMFYNSQFNGDISNWDVSKVQTMDSMFSRSPFNGDLSRWDVSKVTDMARMFSNCPFAQDVRTWSISPTTRVDNMFSGKNEAQWPSQVLARLDEVFPEWFKRQHYLDQSYVRGTHVGHIVSDLRFGPPSYFNRETVQTMKEQQRVAENLGMSKQDAAIYIFEQLLKPTPQATMAGFNDFQLS